MCGIVFLYGPRADARLPECLDRIRHRGPDDRSMWFSGNAALGFNRLEINGVGAVGRQPYTHDDLVAAVNGEIYNFEKLVRDFGLPRSECDTAVVLPLLRSRGLRIIDYLDGFYSAVVFRPSTRELLCLRDHIGKKPLFVGRSRDELFVTSELKALSEVDSFLVVPPGVSKVDIETGVTTQVVEHRPVHATRDVVRLFENAVEKRLPRSNQPIGVFLSGGLDSSLVAAMVSRFRDDAIYLTLGDEGCVDGEFVGKVVNTLGLKDVRTVPLPLASSIPELVRSVVCASESYNPSIISNGLSTFLLARAAREIGIKVIISGEGADELFGGYHRFGEKDPWQQVRANLIRDMHFTELRRLDMNCMAHSVEARCPFLDAGVRSFSDRLGFRDLYSDDENKVTLRRQFQGVLPSEILHRKKVSFDVGSGVRRKVIQYLRNGAGSERAALLKLWQHEFSFDATEPYFHSYPVFDVAIERRGETHR